MCWSRQPMVVRRLTSFLLEYAFRSISLTVSRSISSPLSDYQHHWKRHNQSNSLTKIKPCRPEFVAEDLRYTIAFAHIFQHWNGAGSWNYSSRRQWYIYPVYSLTCLPLQRDSWFWYEYVTSGPRQIVPYHWLVLFNHKTRVSWQWQRVIATGVIC